MAEYAARNPMPEVVVTASRQGIGNMLGLRDLWNSILSRTGSFNPDNPSYDEYQPMSPEAVGGAGGGGSGYVAAQLALDVIAMSEIPFLSQAAGLGSAAIDLYNGDFLGAALGIAGTVPAIGAIADATKVARRAGQLADVAKGGGNLWKVGAYNALQGLEAGLQAHHVGQKSLMGKLVPGYNPANAPSILVPEIGHVSNMPGVGRVAATRGLGEFTNARQVLARDIFELRRVYAGQGIPNSSLQQLIQLNKTMYPGAFIK